MYINPYCDDCSRKHSGYNCKECKHNKDLRDKFELKKDNIIDPNDIGSY